ncbi:hypothetical protein AX17_005422 [Amanita inopinata Kibby_2008]|nr:hypothetical protein AX17_005422 [Amanita inopinata Kibby_2008]
MLTRRASTWRCNCFNFSVVFFALLHLLVSPTQAVLIRTIDDTFGDEATHIKPTFLPGTLGVWEREACRGCVVQPDRSLGYGGTWTAGKYDPKLENTSVTLEFSGTAIYIFFILVNATTECNFTLDGQPAGTFTHFPSMGTYDLIYNATAFSATGLANTAHQLVISTAGIDHNVLVNFDYAVYTYEESDAASTPSLLQMAQDYVTGEGGGGGYYWNHPPASVIVACILGGLAFLALTTWLSVWLFFYISWARQTRTIRIPPLWRFGRTTEAAWRNGPSDQIPRWQNTAVYGSGRPRQSDFSPNPRAFPGGPPQPPPHVQLSSMPNYTDFYAVRIESAPPRRDAPSGAGDKSRKSDEIRLMRQVEINDCIQTAQSELNHLVARQSVRPFPNLPEPKIKEGDGKVVEVDREMGALKERERFLREQIGYLQVQLQSDWVSGLSGEPPPAHTRS